MSVLRKRWRANCDDTWNGRASSVWREHYAQLRQTKMAQMVTKKPSKRSPPHRTTWSSWSSGMSALSDDSEGQQNASAFADTHIESVCVLDIDSDPYSYRMSQVICTIGPASQDPDLLMKMAISGQCRI